MLILQLMISISFLILRSSFENILLKDIFLCKTTPLLTVLYKQDLTLYNRIFLISSFYHIPLTLTLLSMYRIR